MDKIDTILEEVTTLLGSGNIDLIKNCELCSDHILHPVMGLVCLRRVDLCKNINYCIERDNFDN